MAGTAAEKSNSIDVADASMGSIESIGTIAYFRSIAHTGHIPLVKWIN